MQNDNAKPISISKQLVYDAFLRVKANRGSAGIDKVTLEDYEKNLRGNLYKLSSIGEAGRNTEEYWW